MKYFKTFILLFVLFCLFFLLSCQDGDDPSLSNTELLAGTTTSGKTWRIDKIETEIGTVDPFECVSDNNITYFPDGRYEVNEGARKCNPTDPAAFEGTWRFSSQENQISVTIGDSIRIWLIIQLEDKVHRIESDFSDGERIYVLKPI